MRIRVLLIALLALSASARAATLFSENGGVMDIEAESWSNNIPRGGAEWDTSAVIAGSSGAGYVEANPNVGVNQSTTWLTTSPQLDYAVNFSAAGTHYVWVRMFAYTNTDDSVHAGLLSAGPPGSTNTAFGISLPDGATNTWFWTTNRITGVSNRPTINASVGVQTFSLWMREDGARIDRVILTTNVNFKAQTGNVFHIPTNVEVGGLTMRSPVGGIQSNTSVFLYTGNQFQSSGNPGNQLQTGSTIYYRNATNAAWSSLPMFFWTTGSSGVSTNNKYYSNSIPANAFSPGDTVQYYFKIPYDDHLPTFVYGNDNARFNSELESDAQSDPFSYDVQWPLTPAGPYLSSTNVSSLGAVEARIYQNSGHIAVVGPDLAGTPYANTINFAPPSVRVGGESHNIGRVVSATPLGNGLELVQQLSTTTIVARLTFPTDGVLQYEVVDWGGLPVDATVVTAPSDASEHFYGFGEKFNDFDQAGRKVHTITDDPPGTPKGDNSYKVAPWFMSTRGYGFHLDSSAESWFDMRAQFADRYVVSNMFSTLKFNIVYGPRLTDVLTRYTGYTGRPQMSPPWAFAPWMSSDIWRDGGEVRYLITKYRERGIPGSVLVFDSPWEVSYNDFTWNTNQWKVGNTYEGTFYDGFTNTVDMMTFLRTNGFYVVCWMTPFVNTSSNNEGIPGQNTGQSPNYAEGAASNYFVRASSGGPPLSVGWWKGTGSPVDYTNPDAALWVQNRLSNLVAQSSSGGFNVIGGFKTDDGESGNPPGSYIPTTAVYFDGRTGVEMQNGYATEYHKTIWNVLGTNGVLFARSGFTGSQAYPGYWAGDNEPNFGQDNGLQSVVVAAQSAAMSGYSTWASDIGGYQNSNVSSTPTNLFMRWTQFGAFSPLMQMHRQISANNQYPWSYGADALTNYQFYAKLHTALFPYIYSYAKQASTNGLPIIRPMVLLNQDDPNVYGLKHSFYFGNELLVAPVVTNTATTRLVYLPQGKWYDFFTNAVYTGGQNIIWSNATQSLMPVFVREGGIVPMISTNVQTLCDAGYVGNPSITTMTSALEFMIYPATSSSFTVYDGTSVQCQSNGTVVTTTLFSAPRPVLMRFFGAQPFGVERDGVPLQKFANATGFATNSLGWYYDAGTGFVNVKFNHAGGTTKIMFGPDSVGDGISDSWRTNFFGSATTTNDSSCAQCDPDGDGLNNAQEYRAGTEPTNVNSTLKLSGVAFQVVSGTNNFLVAWPSQIGIHYRVLYKDEMSDAVPWQTNAADFNGTGSVLNWLDDGSATGSPPDNSPTGRRFYKVIVP